MMITIRKLIAGMSAFVCMLSLLSLAPAAPVAYAAEEGDYEYSITDSKASITKYNGAGGDVVIPAALGGCNVIFIGANAFSNCDSLTGVTLPAGLEAIGERAFYCCRNIKDLVIPQGVVSIGEEAFAMCFFKANVFIPASVASIAGNAFGECDGLLSFTVDAANPNYSSEDGVLFSKDKTCLIQCPTLKTGDYSIPSGVVKIENHAFWWSRLQTVSLPEGVTTIGDEAFLHSYSLYSVTLPTSLTTIGSSAFQECIKLENMTLPQNLTSIGEQAFGSCIRLQSVNLPAGLVSISDYAFSSCYNLSFIGQIPKNVSYIGKSAFSDCHINSFSVDASNPYYCADGGILYSKEKTSIVSCPTGMRGTVTIPSGITEIPDSMFCGCNLINKVILPSGIAAISDAAFRYCSSLEEINLPNGLTTIGWAAFDQCTALKKINIPSSVTAIDMYSFTGCESLDTITLDASNANYCLYNGLLFSKDLKNLILCPATKSGVVRIPSETTAISDTFHCCPLITGFDVPEDNPKFSCIDGVISDKDKTSLLICPGGKSGLYHIEESISSFYASSFEFNNGITSFSVDENNLSYSCADGMLCDKEGYTLLFCPRGKQGTAVIPKTVQYVDEVAFRRCDQLKAIQVESGNEQYRSIGGSLYNRYSLIACPGSISGAFQVADGTARIEIAAILECPELTSLIIPDSVKSMAYIGDCDKLKKVYFLGNAPISEYINPIVRCNPDLQIYYVSGKTGFGSMWCGYPAGTFDPNASITVTFDTQGGSGINSSSVKFASKVAKPDDPEKVGYALDGWYTEPECTNAWNFDDNIVTEGITLYAKWTAMNRTVTFVSNDGNSVPSQTVPNNSILTAPAALTRDHYQFLGWYKEAACENAWDFTKDKVIADITLYAKWDINKYKVSFDTMGGDLISSQMVKYGATVDPPDAPRKTGHACIGWYSSEAYTDKWDFSTYKVKSDMTLYAKWSLNKYTVSFVSRGGSSISNQPAYFGSTVEQPANPTRNGYSFTGWFKDEECVYPWNFERDRVEGDTVLYAGWSINTYTIQFNSKGGSPVVSVTAQYGTKIESPTKPERPYYEFQGWFSDSSCTKQWNFTINTVEGDLILYAKWVAQASSAYLAGITTSAGALNCPFSAAVYRYTLSLGENDGGVTVSPEKLYDGAAMTINGKKAESMRVSLANGKSTTLTIRLKSGKATKTYTLTVKRPKSANNRLAALSVSLGVLSPAFDPNVSDYRLILPEGAGKVTISAKKESALAKLSPATQKPSLSNGQTKTVKITVKAQSGANRTYKITITRAKSTNANLAKLGTNDRQSPLSPKLIAGISEYTVTLPPNKSAVTLNWKAADKLTKAYVNGKACTSTKITLNSGQSTAVTVVVVAQAGNARTYTVTVRRP